MTYQERTYRATVNLGRFQYFRAICRETDLWIGVSGHTRLELLRSSIQTSIQKLREIIDRFIDVHPDFALSLIPFSYEEPLPDPIGALHNASLVAGTGPMAGIAGLFAREAGKTALQMGADEVLVENGGDIFAKTRDSLSVRIHAGTSPLSDRLALMIPPGEWGICTSSGTVGHSMSFGNADAVCVVSEDPVLADAMATAIANQVSSPEDIQSMLDQAWILQHAEGILIIAGDKVGIRGNLEVTSVPPPEQG